MQVNQYIDHDLESSPIYVMTDSDKGSFEGVNLEFVGSDKYHHAGGLSIYFFSQTKYFIQNCFSVNAFAIFPENLPSDVNKIWKVTLTRDTGGRKLLVHCNDEKVIDQLLSESSCDNWNENWNREVAKIKFTLSDSASDYYLLSSHQPISPGHYKLRLAITFLYFLITL